MITRLPPRIKRPEGQSLQYYRGWRQTLTDWWVYYKPKRGPYRRVTEYHELRVGSKPAPRRTP